MKKSKLKEIISKLVSDELSRQLPNALSEMYIKKIVKENVRVSQPRSLAELDCEDDDIEYDERVPEPMENNDDSIYKKNPFSNNNEIAQKLLSKNNPLHEIYEDIEFIKPNEGVDISQVSENEPQIFGDFFQKMMNTSDNKSSIAQTDTVKENRLDEYRKSLEKQI